MVGVISGLWANAVGGGGIIPIQANWFPASQLLTLKLTGSQGEIMKESMNVALTLAWKLTSPERQKVCTELAQGVHIHCPEGAVPKDGPSAGTAITVALYSLFSDRRIRNDVAITGEITLDGSITEIGGLELKILGGIRAGVKTFLFPSENEKDFQLFVQKQQQKNAARLLDGIVFRKISHISEVLDIVFCSE
jgi:ATP-dependent Lon protease